MGEASFRFLIVDHNADSRRLLTQTLHRRFPDAIFHQAEEGDTAIRIAKSEQLTAIVSHRTYDCDGETLVALFRRLNPQVPIVMVSGYDRSAKAAAAGADAFLIYDQWLRIPALVADLMEKRRRQDAAVASVPASPQVEPV